MGKRIMVVDDSRMIYLQMRNMLADTDYEIAAYCKNGEEAVVYYGEVAPDLVTMDIIMPGMDGIETTKALLTLYPDAKVIMVSSLAYDETYEDAKNIGAKGFIDKPFDKPHVLEVFAQVLGEEEEKPEA